MRKKYFLLLVFGFLVVLAMSSCTSTRSAASSNSNSACNFTPYKKQVKPINIKEGAKIAPRTPVNGAFKVR